MQTPKKYNLMRMLAEIEDDIAAETQDLDQRTDISQDVITSLVIGNARKKRGNDD